VAMLALIAAPFVLVAEAASACTGGEADPEASRGGAVDYGTVGKSSDEGTDAAKHALKE